jgi:hypothetical protein
MSTATYRRPRPGCYTRQAGSVATVLRADGSGDCCCGGGSGDCCPDALTVTFSGVTLADQWFPTEGESWRFGSTFSVNINQAWSLTNCYNVPEDGCTWGTTTAASVDVYDASSGGTKIETVSGTLYVGVDHVNGTAVAIFVGTVNTATLSPPVFGLFLSISQALTPPVCTTWTGGTNDMTPGTSLMDEPHFPCDPMTAGPDQYWVSSGGSSTVAP